MRHQESSIRNGDPPADTIRAELERVIASPGFSRSERLCGFLRYIVEETIAGRGPALKEYGIAIQVYRRPESYDPQVDSIVRVEASKLRKRLQEFYDGDGHDAPIRIALPRGGYVPQFVLNEPAPTRPAKPVRRWRLTAAVVAILVVAVGITAMVWQTGAGRAISIAVLPLGNLSPEAGQDYLAAGMTDVLVTRLAQVRGWRVIPLTAVRQIAQSQGPPMQIASRLRATHLVEGTVQCADHRVRVTVRLVQVEGEKTVWAESYERDDRDVLTLEGELAQTIARRVNVAVTAADRTRLQAGAPANRDAYEAFLKAKYQAGKGTLAALNQAVAQYQEAIRRDPTYAAAYAGLADAYDTLMTIGALRVSDHLAQAKAAARKALELEPDLVAGHIALGSLLESNFEWKEAEQHYLKALALDPNNASAHDTYGQFVARSGQIPNGLREFELARELDPLSLEINAVLGMSLCGNGRYADAQKQFRLTRDLDPNYPRLPILRGHCEVWIGHYQDAIPFLEEGRRLSGGHPDVIGRIGYAYAMAGRTDDARAVLKELEKASAERYVSPYSRAEIYIGLGDRDQAFSWLDRAVDERSFWMRFVRIEPQFNSLRGDPRFQALVKRMGL